jgi:fatty acid desaturase
MQRGAESAALQTIDPYKPYRSRLLSSAKLREFSSLRPLRMVLDTFACWACIVGALTLVALYPTWWAALIAIPVIGSRYYALFIIGHDGIHGRLFEDKRLNNLFNDLFIFAPIGAITRINNKNHLLHHLYLANEGDPDRHKHGSFNKTERVELFAYLLGLSSVISSVKNVFVTNSRLAGKVSYTVGEIVLLLAWQGVLIGSLTYFIGIWAYVLLWWFPVYSFAFLGDNFRSFAEHSHPEADPKADQHRLITYISNPIERFFVAPMNMNFHGAHHLWVSIPYYNLPAADREIRHSSEAQGLEWRRSYFAYLYGYYRNLPLQECKGK